MSEINLHKQASIEEVTPSMFTESVEQLQVSVDRDFDSSSSVLMTKKNFSVKGFYNFTDQESILNRGQKVHRTFVNTLITGSVYSVATSEFLIGVTNLSYALIVGLPKPRIVGNGKTYIIKDEIGGAATTTITVRSAGEENIDGASSATLTTNYTVKSFYSDGANWFTY